jgi:hypothetical protein
MYDFYTLREKVAQKFGQSVILKNLPEVNNRRKGKN